MNPRPLLIDTIAYLSPKPALDGLTADVAGRRVPGASHSIAEIVAHLVFWQDLFCGRCDGTASPMPTSAAIGWPAPDADGWDALRQRFLDGLERLAAIGSTILVNAAAAAGADVREGFTVEDVVVHVANHNAHHLGQIVLLRQLLGAWPPPAGSYTW